MNTPTPRATRESLLQLSLHTEVVIHASPERIWRTLTDFASYREWNKSIPQAAGEARAGAWLDVVIQWPGLKSSPYRLEVLDARPNAELRWLGRFGRPGLMDGDHRFLLEPLKDGKTRVIQAERFSGWLVPFFAPWLKKNVLEGFEGMNTALKQRAEGRADGEIAHAETL